MMGFHFRLDPLLSMRELERLQAQEAFSSAQRAAEEAAMHLDAASTALHNFVTALEERRSRGMTAWEWAATGRQHEGLGAQERVARRELDRALVVLGSRRLELEKALRQEESLQRLRERQWAEHQVAALQSEQVEMDELARLAHLSRREVEWL